MNIPEYKTQLFVKVFSAVVGLIAFFMLAIYPILSAYGIYGYHVRMQRLKETKIEEKLHIETWHKVNNTLSKMTERKRPRPYKGSLIYEESLR